MATVDKQNALKGFQREGERSQLELPGGESQLAPNAKILGDYIVQLRSAVVMKPLCFDFFSSGFRLCVRLGLLCRRR